MIFPSLLNDLKDWAKILSIDSLNLKQEYFTNLLSWWRIRDKIRRQGRSVTNSFLIDLVNLKGSEIRAADVESVLALWCVVNNLSQLSVNLVKIITVIGWLFLTTIRLSAGRSTLIYSIDNKGNFLAFLTFRSQSAMWCFNYFEIGLLHNFFFKFLLYCISFDFI